MSLSLQVGAGETRFDFTGAKVRPPSWGRSGSHLFPNPYPHPNLPLVPAPCSSIRWPWLTLPSGGASWCFQVGGRCRFPMGLRRAPSNSVTHARAASLRILGRPGQLILPHRTCGPHLRGQGGHCAGVAVGTGFKCFHLRMRGSTPQSDEREQRARGCAHQEKGLGTLAGGQEGLLEAATQGCTRDPPARGWQWGQQGTGLSGHQVPPSIAGAVWLSGHPLPLQVPLGRRPAWGGRQTLRHARSLSQLPPPPWLPAHCCVPGSEWALCWAWSPARNVPRTSASRQASGKVGGWAGCPTSGRSGSDQLQPVNAPRSPPFPSPRGPESVYRRPGPAVQRLTLETKPARGRKEPDPPGSRRNWHLGSGLAPPRPRPPEAKRPPPSSGAMAGRAMASRGVSPSPTQGQPFLEDPPCVSAFPVSSGQNGPINLFPSTPVPLSQFHQKYHRGSSPSGFRRSAAHETGRLWSSLFWWLGCCQS